MGVPLASRWRTRLERVFAILLAGSVFASVQLATTNQVGEDGYYHIKVAWLMLQAHSLRIDFPYLPFTILSPSQYTDHHLLFHAFQAPFTLLDLQLAAKLSAAVFATFSLWGVYLLMARSGVRWPLLWLALILTVSPTFLWRQSMPRPQSLALLLVVAVLVAVLARRTRWLFGLGFVSAWLFDGFILPLAVPAAAAGAQLFLERRLEWRPGLALLLGTLTGLLIHPYFPNNIQFALLHLLPKSGLGGPTEVSVGREWYRFDAPGFLFRVGPSLTMMCLGLVPVLIRLWRQLPPSRGSMTLTLLALIFLALQVRSQRIIEYYPAIAVLLPAWSWSFDRPPLPDRLVRWLDRRQIGLAVLAALLVLAGLSKTIPLARANARAYDPVHAVYGAYREAALWLAANSAPGDFVFNTDWDDFPQLFFWNNHNVYASGLDSTYLYLADPDRWRAWKSIAQGDPLPSAALRSWFDAQFVFSDRNHARFQSAAEQDPGLELVFSSPTSLVYRVLPPRE